MRSMLALSASEQTLLIALQRTLLSPLDHVDLDQWRREVCRGAKALLGADKASFALPLPGVEPFFSEELPPPVKDAYPGYAERLDQEWSAFERGCELGAYSRHQLFYPNLDAFYRGAYYNEYIVPAAVFDTVGLNTLLGVRPGPATVAHLLLHHERPTGRKFGERGLGLLRLLHPAFEVGVRTYQRFGEQRSALASLLDRLKAGLLVCDEEGHVLHENTALVEMLASEPEAVQVRIRMQMLARRLQVVLRSAVPATTKLEDETLGAGTRYRLRGSLVEEHVLGGRARVMVSLERTEPAFPSAKALRERFALTRKEAEVARLLAEGRSNDEIAKALFISPHTARHHSEHLREKLGVKSRGEVVGRILLGR